MRLKIIYKNLTHPKHWSVTALLHYNWAFVNPITFINISFEFRINLHKFCSASSHRSGNTTATQNDKTENTNKATQADHRLAKNQKYTCKHLEHAFNATSYIPFIRCLNNARAQRQSRQIERLYVRFTFTFTFYF